MKLFHKCYHLTFRDVSTYCKSAINKLIVVVICCNKPYAEVKFKVQKVTEGGCLSNIEKEP